MIQSLEKLAESEIERKPELLSRDRRIATSLIEGRADRSDIYEVAGSYIDGILAKMLDQAEGTMRDIRAKDIGEDAALEELKLGSKTDVDYIEEAEERKAERTTKREAEKAVVREQEKEAK